MPPWSDCARMIVQAMVAYFSLGNGVAVDLQTLWRSVSPFSACAMCPFRALHVSLHCGHGVCENCVWHWSRRPVHSSLCRFDECPACGDTTSFAVRLRPPTAGYRTLSLDGGGIRGIVELVVLHHIMTRLPPSLGVSQMFDFIVGTSTGSFPCRKPRIRLAKAESRCSYRVHYRSQAVATVEVHRRVPHCCLRRFSQAAITACNDCLHNLFIHRLCLFK